MDLYVESQKHLPSKEIPLETQEGTFYFFKADILKGMITYSTDKSFLANGITISARRAFEIINMNKRGEKPDSLTNGNGSTDPQRPIDLVEQESLTRFDKRKGNNNRKKKKKPTCEVHRSVFCIEKTTRYTSGSKKPMAMSKKPCYDNCAVRQLHNIITGRDHSLWE